MANTFTLKSNSGYGTYQGRYLQLNCTQTKDVATNKSTINWTLTSLGGTSTYYTIEPTTVIINGVQVYYKAETTWNSYVFPAAKGSVSGSVVIDHNTDGSKTINVSMTTGVWHGLSQEYKGTWTLDSIPRQAEITSASNFTDVDNPTIYFSNPGGFAMDVWLEPNPVGDHLCIRTGIPNTGSYTWVLTEAEREDLRSKCSGNSCTIRLGIYTSIGGVQYADYRDMTFTMTENEYTKPFVSLHLSPDNGNLPDKFVGLCIQGKTKFKVSLRSEGKYNATIDTNSYWGTMEGKTYKGTPSNEEGVDAEFTTDVVQGSDSVVVVGYAKDSRNFTGSGAEGGPVIAYSKPLVIPIESQNAILCYRSDGNGIRTGNSTSVWIKAKRSYYTVSGKNQCALQWRRKPANEEWNDSAHIWKDLLPKTATSDEYNALITGEVFDLKNAYTIQVRAIDDIGEHDLKTFDIPTRDVALHLGAGGKNVSIGSYCDYSEEYTFHSEWNAIFDKDVYIGNLKPIGDYMGLDLNNLTSQTGYYVSASAPTEAAGCYNFPVAVTGMLTVIGIGGFSYQTYTTYNGFIYTRSYYKDSGWTAWKQVQLI